MKPIDLVGKTIASCEEINAEYGRTYNSYLCLTFTDGTKQMIGLSMFRPYSPCPAIEDMKKAPKYFSAEDIANAVLRNERRKRQYAEDEERRQRAEYEALSKKFGATK